MNTKLGSIILYLVCFILGAMFLTSLALTFSHPPSSFSGLINVALRAWGLYCIYAVVRFKNQDSAWSLRLTALVLGGSAIIPVAFVAYSLSGVMQRRLRRQRFDGQRHEHSNRPHFS